MPEAAGLSYEYHGGEAAITGWPPLVLIHGAGGTRLYWPPGLRRLQGCAVYTPDLPGHGASPGPGQSTIDGYCQVVEAWMEALELPPAVVVGHSMGGAVAQALALDASARVAGLVLIATGARLRVHPMLLEATQREGLAAEALSTLLSAWYSDRVSASIRQRAVRSLSGVDPAVLHGDFQACDRFDVMERLGDLRVPALVLVGEEDQMTPVKYARFLAEHLPAARLEVIPAAGHMVMLEQPAAVEKALADWLEAVYPRS